MPIETETVDVTTADGVADAYLARPDVQPRTPAVLFLMDAFGLRPRIAEMIERIAARGYVVLAPNLFHRSGRAPLVEKMPDLSDPADRGRFFEILMPLMQALTPERIAADGRAYLDYLQTLRPGPVAITGYCMGGRVGWQIAATSPDRVAALGAFHAGRLVTDDPDSPHLLAPSVKARCYFGFADNDQSMSAEQIRALEQTLAAGGVRYRAEVYEGAAHGYTMADTAAYNEAACERHFTELFALLDSTA